MLTPLLALTLAGAAMAADGECVACCRAAGLAGCRSTLKMYGEGSMAAPEAGAWRVLGLWFLDCGGQGRFESGSTTVVATMPVSGELLLAGVPPAAFHCFTQACTFPESACFEVMAEERVRLVDCRDGAPMPASQLTRAGPTPPGNEAIIAVVGDRPLVVTPLDRASTSAPEPTPQACCGQTPARGLLGQSPPASAAVVTQADPMRIAEGNASPAPPELAGSEWVRSGAGDYVLEIPEPPLTNECGVAEVLRTESRRRVETGNEAVIRGDIQHAIDGYRAALTLDPCNPYAWADLGTLALQLDMHAQAAIALSQAVEIQPRHYTAYTNLGLAYEGLDQPSLASDAFRIALALRPHHAAAQQGLERVQGP